MDRHWFPAILLGFSILLALAFAVVLSPQGQDLLNNNPQGSELSTPPPAITDEAYVSAVTTLLNEYVLEQNAESTYNALIAVRVPGTMLNLHYELVIAFGKLVSNEDVDAQARLTALKAQYPWLPL